MRLAHALLFVAGCGRLDFDPAVAADASVPPSGPFLNARPIPALASPVEADDPEVSADGLELYYASKTTGQSKIWVSRRTSRTEDWPAPQQVLELDASSDDKAPALSPDGLTLYMVEVVKIAVSMRSSLTSPWSPPQIVLDMGLLAGTPAVCNDGRRLYLREGSSSVDEDLYVTDRASVGDPWPTPVVIPELSSLDYDSGPWVTADCSRIYFDSGRGPTPGEVYMAQRDPQTATFGAPITLPELKAAVGTIHDVSLTADERYIVFSHTVGTTSQIFDASR